MPSTDPGIVDGEFGIDPGASALVLLVVPPSLDGTVGADGDSEAIEDVVESAPPSSLDELQPTSASTEANEMATKRAASRRGERVETAIRADSRTPAARYRAGMPDGTYSVAELVEGVRAAVAARFADPVWVHGEIAGIKRGRNGHVWFDLVDRDDAGGITATLPVVLWSSVRVGVNTQLKRAGSIRMDDGVRIRIMGPLDLWVPGGRLQLQMQGIDPTYTLGLLASERDRVLRALETDGLLGRNKELTLPTVPRRIGLVTAAGSAAEADFLQTLADSPLTWEVIVVDARVQGAGSERSVAAALLAAAGAGVDLVALVRGGGARTDLATFDQEIVARTIATLGVPVLTGIGHEIDTSVADRGRSLRPQDTHRLCRRHRRPRPHHGGQGRGGLARITVLARRRITNEAARIAGHATPYRPRVRTRLAVEDHRADVASLRLRRTAPTIDRGVRSVERRAGHAQGAARSHLRLHAHTLDALTTRIAPAGTAGLRRADAALAGAGAHLSALDPARALTPRLVDHPHHDR